MKGIILAGGRGVRLQPLTKVISKALLTVYNKPLIMYPLQTLIEAGVKDILIIVPPDKIKDFKNLLNNGEEMGVKISYKVQKEPKGMADAVSYGEKFVGKDSVVVIAADNVYEDSFKKSVKNFKSGCKVFLRKVADPERYGVIKFDKKGKPIDLIEKPKKFVSNYAITAMYIYDHRVFSIIKNIKPSGRGELEITDINRWYLKHGELKTERLKGKYIDAGTFDSLLEANIFIAGREGSKLAKKCQI